MTYQEALKAYKKVGAAHATGFGLKAMYAQTIESVHGGAMTHNGSQKIEKLIWGPYRLTAAQLAEKLAEQNELSQVNTDDLDDKTTTEG
jgi:hypothetical protein